jgi:hypothetical protein
VERVILTPKIHVYRWLLARNMNDAVAHYYGVPPLQYRRVLLGLKPKKVLLLGDLDPFDIATWRHLRRIMRGSTAVEYNWAMDGTRVLAALGSEVLARCSIPMESKEREWWRAHQGGLPELESLFNKLGSGKKLEIDALVTLDDGATLGEHFAKLR